MKNMKKWMNAAVAVLLLALLSGCTRPATDRYVGTYTYKTSGTVTVEVKVNIPVTGATVSPGTYTFELTPEVGRMDIKGYGDDTILVSMNALGGVAQAFEAVLTADGFQLVPATRMLQLGLLPKMEVTVSGNAFLLDGVLYLHLNYSGKESALITSFSITDSDVLCLATISRNL